MGAFPQHIYRARFQGPGWGIWESKGPPDNLVVLLQTRSRSGRP